MHTKRVILAALVAAASVQGVRAEELTAAKRADIQRLLEVTGSAAMGKQFAFAMSRAMFDVLKTSQPDFPETALAVVEQEVTQLISDKIDDPDGLFAMVIPVYHRYFTQREIRELIAFYQSPIGKKTVSVMPKVVQESMSVGQQWGRSLGPEIEQRVLAALRREGILPSEEEAPPAK